MSGGRETEGRPAHGPPAPSAPSGGAGAQARAEAPPMHLAVDADIRRARTLPAAFYTDAAAFAAARERIFARSWQLVGDVHALAQPGACLPLTLLPGLLDEPLLLTRPAGTRAAGTRAAETRAGSGARSEARSGAATSAVAGASAVQPAGAAGRFAADEFRCLSNVCTHRGLLLCEEPRSAARLQCRYHGRRFALDGRFLAAPEFEGALDFPSPRDDLPRVALARWGPLLFASLDPVLPFAEWIAALDARIGWLPLDRARLHADRSRDYSVAAHWAMYCDNYLEGFHIPYVHPSLAGALDYGSYRTELFAHSNLQVGVAAAPAPRGASTGGASTGGASTGGASTGGAATTGSGSVGSAGAEAVFDLPHGSPDYGHAIAGYYFWLFPNTMVNVYPWGLSLNIVKPTAVHACVVSFLSYVWDEALLDRGAGAGLDRVQREDESVVEAVQRGLLGRLYRGGRYAPAREACVHHFHRLLAAALRDS